MLAMRQIMLGPRGGAKVPTAADYVQDGLVAMWDGIENAGWRTHDASATTWKDLIGSADATLQSSGSWGSNSLLCAGGTIAAQDGSSIDTFRTMEICLKRTGTATAFVVVVSSGNGNGVLIVKDNLAFGFGYYNNTRYYPPTNEISSGATICGAWDNNPASSADVAAYVNGASVARSATESNPGFGSGGSVVFGARQYGIYPFAGKIYCVRLYSRALTAAEIAANYAIDKERFNLP